MANRNMRKMYTEQQIVDLVKQNGVGGTQLYKHSLNIDNEEINIIGTTKEEYELSSAIFMGGKPTYNYLIACDLSNKENLIVGFTLSGNILTINYADGTNATLDVSDGITDNVAPYNDIL